MNTKTSGPGKKAAALHAFVMRGISLTGYDWLKEGFNLIHSGPLAWHRDHLAFIFEENWVDFYHMKPDANDESNWLQVKVPRT